jgi:hypothetical protein
VTLLPMAASPQLPDWAVDRLSVTLTWKDGQGDAWSRQDNAEPEPIRLR